jgi:hypothetical protein
MRFTQPYWTPKSRGCGKVGHGSRVDAERVRERMVAEGACSAGELEIYRCSCGYWHLGHPLGWRQRQLDARASRAEGRS